MQARAQDEGPKVQRVAALYIIDSTKALVTAYNKATDSERAILLEWLRNYDRRRRECLSDESIPEYAELAGITPRSAEDKRILKNLVTSLYSSIREGEFLEENAAAALYKALVYVDPSIYGGVGVLVKVAKRLLSSLSPEPRLTRENFAEFEATFLALRQTLLLLSETNQSGVCGKEKRELRQAIAEKERAMDLSCKHYPVSFHFKTLRQAVERIGTEDASSHLPHAMQHSGSGLCGFLYAFHYVRTLTRGDIDPAAVQDSYTKARDALANVGVSKKPWFDTFKNLITARQEASKDKRNRQLFEISYGAAMRHQRNMTDAEDLKALRYGILRELGTLALEGPSENARFVATLKLVDLATHHTVDEGWTTNDSDVLIALLDAVCELRGIGKRNEDIKNALRDLHQSGEGPAKEELAEWLHENIWEVMRRERSRRGATVERKDLCIRIGRDVGYIPLATVKSKREKLRSRYLRDDFAIVLPRAAHPNRIQCLVSYVTSLFEEESPKHVKDMKDHVVIYEEIIEEREIEVGEESEKAAQRVEEKEGSSSDCRGDQAKAYYEKQTRVTKPIALDDLFKRRSLKPGDPESEVRRVLLYGNPGSGKTCIARVVAHKWALGEMVQAFNAVYVVPVRVLNEAEGNGQEWTRLEEAILQICFCGDQHVVEHEEDMVSLVEYDLDDPSTLLVLDGLDEANDHARELVSTVWKRSCKILLLSRPHNMEDIEGRVDMQVECLGFNDEQLRDYTRSELSQENRLGELLNEEYFLSKVFKYLVDDGLHECRRVCRRWRDACGKAPVKLRGSYLDKLNTVADLFPKAVSLDMKSAFDDDDAVGRQAIHHLTRLKNLQNLDMDMRFSQADIDFMMTTLPSTDLLRSLAVLVDQNDRLNELVHALRFLTNLEALTVNSYHFLQTDLDLDPVTELQGLRYLNTNLQVIINSRGELIFPSLTKLTFLLVYGHMRGFELEPSLSIQSILPYAQTLELLDVNTPYYNRDLPSPEEHPLIAFSRLSSLCLDCCFCRPNDSLFRALREMRHLTKLGFNTAEEQDVRVLAEYLSLLTGLKSLFLSGSDQSSILPENEERKLMSLTQLTELTLSTNRIDHYLPFPTGIQTLNFVFTKDPQVDFAEILMPMTDLTSLWISVLFADVCLFRRHGVTPRFFSRKLEKLKHLTIRGMLVDDLFVEALSRLTQLTSLVLHNSVTTSVDPYTLCPRLSNLSELKMLQITSSEKTVVRNDEFPQLCLPKLRELDLPLSGTDANMRKALWKTLPCLRKMSLSGKSFIFE